MRDAARVVSGERGPSLSSLGERPDGNHCCRVTERHGRGYSRQILPKPFVPLVQFAGLALTVWRACEMRRRQV